MVSAFHDPTESNATGMKMCLMLISVYFVLLAMSALSGAASVCREVLSRWDFA